jgi:hypothetical protein
MSSLFSMHRGLVEGSIIEEITLPRVLVFALVAAIGNQFETCSTTAEISLNISMDPSHKCFPLRCERRC